MSEIQSSSHLAPQGYATSPPRCSGLEVQCERERESDTMAESWLTTNQAAELLKYHPDHVRRLIRAGLIKAERFGTQWKVSRASMLAYVRKMEKQGERRGPKRS